MSKIDWNAKSGFFQVNGKALEFATWGPEPDRAATILLLHEGLGAVGLWRDFPAALAAQTGLGVLAYSRAGYGRSDPADLPRPVNYMTNEALDVLPVVLDQSGLERAILLGHSDGATIAAIYAGLAKDPRLCAAILMAPHFFTEEPGLQAISKACTAFETGDLRTKLGKYHADPDNAFRGWNDAWLNPDFHDWNVESVLDGVSVPLLAIQGVDDEYGTLAQMDAISNRLGDAARIVVLEDCGHAPHLEQPAATLAATFSFIAGLEH